MAKNVKISKTVYNKDTFNKVIDREFKSFTTPVDQEQERTIEQFFSELGQEIERSFRLVRRELTPGGEAETALIYLYQQATLGLEPRQKIATRKPPGTKQIISRELILEAGQPETASNRS